MRPIRTIFTLRNYAVLLLILYCIVYIPIETRSGVSIIKFAVCCTCPIIWLWKTPYISRAGILVMAYFFCALASALFHYETFRASTVLYLLSFLLLYWTFYNLVYINKVLTLPYFIKWLRRFLLAYTILLLVQQMFILFQIKLFPLINLCQFLDRGLGANSLASEPSMAARIMGVLFYAYLKCNEYLNGEPVSFPSLFKGKHKWVTWGFLWSMVTMGSGTAFISLLILSLYFIRRKYLFYIAPIFLTIYFIIPFSENRSLHRARDVISATMTFDSEKIREVDSSAAARINPMVNTLTKLDFSDIDTWFGHGIDYGHSIGGSLSSQSTVGEISDYGLIVYLLGLLLVFSCSIKIVSLPTIMYFIGIGGGTANIPYLWGILMVFLCVRYFSTYDSSNEQD